MIFKYWYLQMKNNGINVLTVQITLFPYMYHNRTVLSINEDNMKIFYIVSVQL